MIAESFERLGDSPLDSARVAVRGRSRREFRARIAMVALIATLVGSMLCGVFIGATRIHMSEVVAVLTGTAESSLHAPIILQLRLPRVLLGVLAGGILGMAGAASQGLFRNSLAEPGLIGISSGAALAVVLVTVLGVPTMLKSVIPSSIVLPLAAFAGAALTTMAVQVFALTRGGTSSSSLILAGVAANAFAGAFTGLLFFYADDAQLRSATFWSLGSLGAASWKSLAFAAPIIAISGAGLWMLSRALNVLQLGDAEAAHLGLRVNATRHALLALIALGVGTAVSLTGVIGFVGLVVPHLVRLVIGPNHDRLLPASALLGGALLVMADVGARMLAVPAELPIGVITALIGAPFFLWLLSRAQKEELQ